MRLDTGDGEGAQALSLVLVLFQIIYCLGGSGVSLLHLAGVAVVGGVDQVVQAVLVAKLSGTRLHGLRGLRTLGLLLSFVVAWAFVAHLGFYFGS